MQLFQTASPKHPRQRSRSRLVAALLLASIAPLAAQGAAPLATSSDMARNASQTGAQGSLALSAIMTDDGMVIDQGLTWFVFAAGAGADGKRALVTSTKAAQPQLLLDAGDYFVTAAFGRATLTRKVTVVASRPTQEKFNLQAGGLKLLATLPGGESAPENAVLCDVLNEDRDQEGNRTRLINGVRPGLILRLTAGVYQIVCTWGDANARVRSEVTVYPGKMTEATLIQAGAKITFKLVPRSGGDALADVTWKLVDTKAQIVKETAGAVPTHIIAAGRYAIEATHQGKTFRAEFSAKSGDTAIVEVVAK